MQWLSGTRSNSSHMQQYGWPWRSAGPVCTALTFCNGIGFVPSGGVINLFDIVKKI